MPNRFILELRAQGIPVKDNERCDCPKCDGEGYVNDWDGCTKIAVCRFCKGAGELSPNKYINAIDCQIKGY